MLRRWSDLIRITTLNPIWTWVQRQHFQIVIQHHLESIAREGRIAKSTRKTAGPENRKTKSGREGDGHVAGSRDSPRQPTSETRPAKNEGQGEGEGEGAIRGKAKGCKNLQPSRPSSANSQASDYGSYGRCASETAGNLVRYDVRVHARGGVRFCAGIAPRCKQ